MQPSRANHRQQHRTDATPFASQDIQVLVVVDLQASFSEDELRRSLPPEYLERFVLRLTEFGVSRLQPNTDGQGIDWPAIATAVEALVTRVNALCEGALDQVTLFIGGHGPSPIFIHLGYRFARMRGRQFIAKPLSGGAWEQPLPEPQGTNSSLEKPFFDVVTGLPSSPIPCSGRTVIAMNITGRYVPDDVLVDFITDEAEPMGGLVKLGTSRAMHVEQFGPGAIARELLEFWSALCNRFPRHEGIALFFDGPGHLAYALGHSMNLGLADASVWLTNYRHPAHERVYSLPLAPAVKVIPLQTSDGEGARQRVFTTMAAAISELQSQLDAHHLPADSLRESERMELALRLRSVEPCRKPNQALPCRLMHGQFLLGDVLLEAHCNSSAKQQQHVAKLLVLRELFSHFHGARNHHQDHDGPSGLVLEQFSIVADSFALRTLINSTFSSHPPESPAIVHRVVEDWIGSLLYGMESLDQLVHGPKINQLTERQLRLYLVWHLQLARSRAVRKPSHVHELLAPPIFVELTPLATRTDTHRYERHILRALDKTELYCSAVGHIIRVPRRPGFDPSGLVEAVRTYARTPIQSAMAALAQEHRHQLTAWKV